jgi:hypothetical protein
MSLAVLDDYFTFMSDKSGGKPVSPDPRVVVQPAKALERPEARRQEPQIEVSESALSDTVIERIFRRPNPG